MATVVTVATLTAVLPLTSELQSRIGSAVRRDEPNGIDDEGRQDVLEVVVVRYVVGEWSRLILLMAHFAREDENS